MCVFISGSNPVISAGTGSREPNLQVHSWPSPGPAPRCSPACGWPGTPSARSRAGVLGADELDPTKPAPSPALAALGPLPARSYAELLRVDLTCPAAADCRRVDQGRAEAHRHQGDLAQETIPSTEENTVSEGDLPASRGLTSWK